MELNVSVEQAAFIRDGIAEGRFRDSQEALQQAMSLWEEKERRRLEILAAVELSRASLAHGEGRHITTPEQSSNLAESIRQRASLRLAAEERST